MPKGTKFEKGDYIMVYDNKEKTIKPKISKENYTVDVLLDVLQSYKRQIERSGKEYHTVVLSDISASIDFVLRNCERI